MSDCCPTIHIAAADAPDWAKEQADLVSSGDDDAQIFAMALDMLQERGGGTLKPHGTWNLGTDQ